MQLLIQRALNPAKISNMEINEESGVEVFLTLMKFQRQLVKVVTI